jgi:hypothetical protein
VAPSATKTDVGVLTSSLLLWPSTAAIPRRLAASIL